MDLHVFQASLSNKITKQNKELKYGPLPCYCKLEHRVDSVFYSNPHRFCFLNKYNKNLLKQLLDNENKMIEKVNKVQIIKVNPVNTH